MASQPDLSQVFDLIFAGGGTAACVAAGRLAKANPNLKILIIEGGPNNFNNPTVRTPATFIAHFAPDAPTAIRYKAEASKNVNNRECIVMAGGTLGGGSSINGMMYTRAQAIDFDSWETEGWYAKDLMPLANKAEKYHPAPLETPKEGKHGYDGPIEITGEYKDTASADQFMETVKEMGYKEIVDIQDFERFGGFSRWKKFVGRDGKRQDTAHCYIHPLLQSGNYPNLQLLFNTNVIRVICDESSPPRAIGVEFKSSDSSTDASIGKAMAKKCVILAAGTLGTPQILERSGVGSFKLLNDLKIPVVSDLPGVGENYQDHLLVGATYKTSLAYGQTLDGIMNGTYDLTSGMKKNDPFLAWNGFDIGAKLLITPEEATAISPTFASSLQISEGAAYGKRPHMITGIFSARLGDPTEAPLGQYIVALNYTAYPSCRGYIHITSPTSGYRFQPNFMDNELDVGKQIWAYKKLREVMRRLPYFAGELEIGHPAFAADSPAATVPEAFQRKEEIRDVVYSEEDDGVIEAYIRNRVNTTWHSLGTCAMAPREKGGVVDGDLDVYGTKGLKVADLSMVPQNVGQILIILRLLWGRRRRLFWRGSWGLSWSELLFSFRRIREFGSELEP